ncbi:MAG: metallophosphoesterase [Cruoricaptor ignavus]|nr:metallophosphoesterase [Cruoricaptor ignavus]
MKFFNINSILGILISLLWLQSCASYKLQKGKDLNESVDYSSPISHQMFLIGDAGNADEPQALQTLAFLKNKLDSADKNSMLIFLGDNIYPLGMPKKSSKDYPLAKIKLENQLAITKNYKGKTLVIPGNHDWYHGLKGLQAQEEAVIKYLKDKKSFLPKSGCPVETININNDIKLIAIDTQWYVTDWNKEPNINKNCEITTRFDFLTELDSQIKKNQNKTIVIALHHPVITAGNHGNFTSLREQLFLFNKNIPLPIVATFINVLKNASGASNADLSNKHYTELANSIKNLIQNNENVILISGHDHNLQYLEEGNIKQILSGAGSKTNPVTLINETDFSYGKSGFAILNFRENGSADTEFYSTQDNQLKKLSHIAVLKPAQNKVENLPLQNFPKTYTATVYEEKDYKKSKFYEWLAGKHYRKYYGTKIEAQTAVLDTLYGGLKPLRAGGGTQSNSLRLIDKDGQEFTMRALKKDAQRFLNSAIFTTNSFGQQFSGSSVESIVQGFYTTNHPYTPFSVNNLSEKIGILHSNPKLFYVPKQNALQQYNQNYGDALYMIEERFSSDKKTLSQLDNATDISNTMDVMANLKKSEKYEVDKNLYIRSRLFDMLIGDWDRHQDQWKWAAYETDNKTIYKPIPRDRDQAFVKYDGFFLKFLIRSIPMMKHMWSFEHQIKNLKLNNNSGYPLDLIFAKNANEQDWISQAKYIQNHLTDEDLKEAFLNLPNEVKDETITEIIEKLKSRRDDLPKYAAEYYRILQKKVPLVGTDKKDKFVITKSKNDILVEQFLVKKNSEILMFSKSYNDKETKDIYIYGLNDDDTFIVTGNGNPKINLKLVGGLNHDIYKIEKGKRTKIYDFASQKNTYELGKATRKSITDDYTLNTYHYKRIQHNYKTILPMLNYNPDDGVKIGATANYVVNNFITDPFSQKHSIKANFYTATSGFELAYNGFFRRALGQWDFNLDARYTTPAFSQNFFGLSNESDYDKEEQERSYHRTKISQLHISPSVSISNWLNFTNRFRLNFENNNVEKTANRFIAITEDINPEVFGNMQFASADYSLIYESRNSSSFPTFGLFMLLNGNWRTNLGNFNKNFVTLHGTLNIDHRIDKKGKLVFGNSTNAKWINNNNFEFYHAANIGGNRNLRSYRNERFSGRSYFTNSSDIRLNFGKLKNKVAPTDYGIFAGYDFGRVWNDDENSRKWHQSFGGGIWFGALEAISAQAQYFYGSDGGRFSVGFGFGF